jgi:cytochrome c
MTERQCARRLNPVYWSAVLLLALMSVALLAGCGDLGRSVPPAVDVPGGNPTAGRQAVIEYGCHSCHIIPGIIGPQGHVGPPLTNFARRSFVGGVAPNTTDNLILWIQNPQALNPLSAMPALGVTEQDARNMAAYLYTIQ